MTTDEDKWSEKNKWKQTEPDLFTFSLSPNKVTDGIKQSMYRHKKVTKTGPNRAKVVSAVNSRSDDLRVTKTESGSDSRGITLREHITNCSTSKTTTVDQRKREHRPQEW